ncbi:MAG: hypothetical protein JST28_17820 [Acidobacteria bacterium]|nr:hypothetical protein [Acidobacteriota bacterium]
MVQHLLKNGLAKCGRVVTAAAFACLLASVAWAGGKPKVAKPSELWQLSLDGGRSLTWEHSFSSESEVKPNRGFWNKLVDVVAGSPDFKFLVRPYSVISDSKGRIIVTDPGASGVHVFDFGQKKYKFIERREKVRDAMLAPQCVAVDGQDNIYVTDSESGKIFVFEPSGKYLRAIGSLKGGEGYFKRPTGIAIDASAQRMYVTDTLRDEIFILDLQGKAIDRFGETGQGEGEFNLPTELRLSGDDLLVVDSMNFRIQAFNREGKFEFSIGKSGDTTGAIFRPKAVSVDSERNVYVVDAQWGAVQVFNRQGQLLYYFGAKGTHAGEFQLPSGLFIDHDDRVYVVDSFNRRVQVFQYAGVKNPTGGQ